MLNRCRLLVLLLVVVMHAVQAALSSTVIKQPYTADGVTQLLASPGMMTQIVFAENEKILTIQNGDLDAWMVRVDKMSPYMLFIKPTLVGSNTNMTVVTNHHSYYFHLMSEAAVDQVDSKQPYAIRFQYRQTKSLTNRSKHTVHHMRYSYSGDRSIKPVSVYDDGQFIYMRFNQQQPLPAVFAVSTPLGREAMVNVRYANHQLIVERLEPQLTLRLGKSQVGSVFNDEWIDQYG